MFHGLLLLAGRLTRSILNSQYSIPRGVGVLSSIHRLLFVEVAEAIENILCSKRLKKISELGWIGLIIPETYGGSGAEFTSLLVLFEEEEEEEE